MYMELSEYVCQRAKLVKTSELVVLGAKGNECESEQRQGGRGLG